MKLLRAPPPPSFENVAQRSQGSLFFSLSLGLSPGKVTTAWRERLLFLFFSFPSLFFFFFFSLLRPSREPPSSNQALLLECEARRRWSLCLCYALQDLEVGFVCRQLFGNGQDHVEDEEGKPAFLFSSSHPPPPPACTSRLIVCPS